MIESVETTEEPENPVTPVTPEKTEEQYERECEQIGLMFPDAKFVVSIEFDYLDEVVSDLPAIIVKNARTCYCYDGKDSSIDYFYISGIRLTNAFIIKQLIEQGLNLACNHCFLEGFRKTKNSDCQFEICTGS
jgi:hypothetical protein